MTHLAFKCALAAGDPISLGIAKVTGGKYSHVELWLSGPQDQALCYSSREPYGTSFATLDLRDATRWTVVPVALTPEQETALYWFCRGSAGRPYDFRGLLGIAFDIGAHNRIERFCSEACTEALQSVAGLLAGVLPWHVAPSGFVGQTDRAGLYELASSAN